MLYDPLLGNPLPGANGYLGYSSIRFRRLAITCRFYNLDSMRLFVNSSILLLRLNPRNFPLRFYQAKLEEEITLVFVCLQSKRREGGSFRNELLTIANIRQTGSLGCAPTPNQYLALGISSLMSLNALPCPSGGSLGIGSYVPRSQRYHKNGLESSL
jgi:hypothetical protein